MAGAAQREDAEGEASNTDHGVKRNALEGVEEVLAGRASSCAGSTLHTVAAVLVANVALAGMTCQHDGTKPIRRATYSRATLTGEAATKAAKAATMKVSLESILIERVECF